MDEREAAAHWEANAEAWTAHARAGYDRYRDIRYKPERALWRREKLPFELQFFHQGLYYDRPVRIREISASHLFWMPDVRPLTPAVLLGVPTALSLG